MNDTPDENWTKSQIISELSKVADNAEAWLKKVADDRTIKPAEMAKAFFYIDQFHDEVKAALTRIYHVVDAIDKGVFPALLEHNGVDMVRVPELARSFSIRQMTSASMLDKERGVQWLRDNGHGDLIQETVNAGTLASFFRNMILEEGIDPPEDIFKVSTYKKMGSAKYTPKPGTTE